tara:strand:- start:116 stop:547 length:432 start_codon:yes stop_codon:yes gene_type:complete
MKKSCRLWRIALHNELVLNGLKVTFNKEIVRRGNGRKVMLNREIVLKISVLPDSADRVVDPARVVRLGNPAVNVLRVLAHLANVLRDSDLRDLVVRAGVPARVVNRGRPAVSEACRPCQFSWFSIGIVMVKSPKKRLRMLRKR